MKLWFLVLLSENLLFWPSNERSLMEETAAQVGGGASWGVQTACYLRRAAGGSLSAGNLRTKAQLELSHVACFGLAGPVLAHVNPNRKRQLAKAAVNHQITAVHHLPYNIVITAGIKQCFSLVIITILATFMLAHTWSQVLRGPGQSST